MESTTFVSLGPFLLAVLLGCGVGYYTNRFVAALITIIASYFVFRWLFS